MVNIDELLLRVEKPARYVGGEYNQPNMDKPHKVDFCIAFPDVYEVGMSNLGIQILYDILNADKDVVCERCFAPWIDMGKLLKESNLPLFSIETRKPLKDFDILGFSLQYELCYTNLVYMLDLAGIPYFAKDRDESYPIMLAGGPCVANPEPFADFFDVICIGDGEEFDLAFAKIVAEHKGDKKKILEEVAKLQGAYVPSLCKVENGVCVTPVQKAVVKNLDSARFPIKPLVPNLEVVHDRPVVELFRGCYAGCRFCQACFFYRPIRVREKETVVGICDKLFKNVGCEELGFSSLSTGDYPNVIETLKETLSLADSKHVKVQLPSLRLDSFTAELTRGAKKSSLTFAPEAGTQRLRNVINKNITEEDIDRTMRLAFNEGYRSVKLYFMIGLPTETDEDVLGIPKLVERIRNIYFEIRHKNDLSVNVSTSVFVPKPVTPFQWVAQLPVKEMIRRQQLVREGLRKMKGVIYSWHDEPTSYLEGVYARGGREIAALTVLAYQKGAYFDGWSEYFHNDIWMAAIAESGINVDKYVSEWNRNETLPWDFIDFGVTRKYLLQEYDSALAETPHEGCKFGCKGCGANKYAECKVQKA